MSTHSSRINCDISKIVDLVVRDSNGLFWIIEEGTPHYRRLRRCRSDGRLFPNTVIAGRSGVEDVDIITRNFEEKKYVVCEELTIEFRLAKKLEGV